MRQSDFKRECNMKDAVAAMANNVPSVKIECYGGGGVLTYRS